VTLRRHDLEVVVGGVGEGALAVAVAQGPDAISAGAQLLVDDDVAARVDGDAGRFQPKIVGIRPAPHGEQHVGSDHLPIAGAAIDVDTDICARRLEADAFGGQPRLDSLRLEDLLDGGRHLRVLVLDQAVGHLDDRDLRPEASIDLSEFEAHVAAADDHEMARQLVQGQQAGVGEGADLIDARQGWNVRPAPHIDEDPLGGEALGADADLPRGFEPRLAPVHGAVGEPGHPPFDAVPLMADHAILPGGDLPHVDGDAAVQDDAVVGGATRHVGGAGAGH